MQRADKKPLPKYVEKELHLTCKMLSEGFTRAVDPWWERAVVTATISMRPRQGDAGRAQLRRRTRCAIGIRPVMFHAADVLTDDSGSAAGEMRVSVLCRTLHGGFGDAFGGQSIAGLSRAYADDWTRLNFDPRIHGVGIDGVYSLDEHTGLPRRDLCRK